MIGAAVIGVAEYGGAFELGAARLLYMLRMAPRWRALADVLDGRYARLAGVVELFRVGFDLDNAVGVQLDIIGAWLGRAREGMVDARYRRALRTQVLILKSANGSGPNLIAVFASWVQSLPLTYRNVPPAYVEITGVVPAEDMALLRVFIRLALPGGVAFEVIGTSTPPLIADSVQHPITDPGVADSFASPQADARPVAYRIV